MNVLAQLFPEKGPQVPPLPGPPLWEKLLLEQPVYLSGFLILAAIVALAMLRQRGRSRQGAIVAGALVLAAIAIYALGAAVTTEREQMADATTALVDAAATGNPALVDPMLAPDVRLFTQFRAPGVSVPTGALDKPAILDAMRRLLSEYPLKEHTIGQMQAQSTGPGVGRTQVRLRVVAQQYEVPIGSWWLIGWKRTNGRWVATSIEPLYIAGATR
jgi:hypothetical protein